MEILTKAIETINTNKARIEMLSRKLQDRSDVNNRKLPTNPLDRIRHYPREEQLRTGLKTQLQNLADKQHHSEIASLVEDFFGMAFGFELKDRPSYESLFKNIFEAIRRKGWIKTYGMITNKDVTIKSTMSDDKVILPDGKEAYLPQTVQRFKDGKTVNLDDWLDEALTRKLIWSSNPAQRS